MTREKNIVASWLEPGLKLWQRAGAEVTHLKTRGRGRRLPRIFAPHTGKKDQGAVVVATGFHLEETSGPRFVLNPQNFTAARRDGFSFLVYPVINRYGLNFPETDRDDRNLRRNENGQNYNDLWGSREPRPWEVNLVEKDISRFAGRQKITAFTAHHEDSDWPGKGFVYTLGLRQRQIDHLALRCQDSPIKQTLAGFSSTDGKVLYGGHPYYGFIISGSRDGKSFESWARKTFRRPTVLVEAPFGEPLELRVNFHCFLVQAVLNCLQG